MRHAQLKAFHAVAVHTGFSRAAEALGLTQPAVSDHVRKLEETYGVQLFTRAPSGVALTGMGRKLFAIAERQFEAEAEAALGRLEAMGYLDDRAYARAFVETRARRYGPRKLRALLLARGVPEEVVRKPPTADLIPGQTDEADLGLRYLRADVILEHYLKGYSDQYILGLGFTEEELRRVKERVNRTHWKRALPTVALLSSTAIGEFYLRPLDYRP